MASEARMLGDKLTVGAVGVGAIGTILMAHLAEAGVRIVAADLPHRIAQINDRGLSVKWGDKRLRPRIESVDSIRALADKDPDCIFVSVKTCILNRLMPDIAIAA